MKQIVITLDTPDIDALKKGENNAIEKVCMFANTCMSACFIFMHGCSHQKKLNILTFY